MLLQKAGHAPAKVFSVETLAGIDQTTYNLTDTGTEICAAVFEHEGLADWLAEMANTDPRRGQEIASWRAWVDKQNHQRP